MLLAISARLNYRRQRMNCFNHIDMNSITYNLPDNLAAPAKRALDQAGIKMLNDLANHTEAEVLAMHGIGKNAMVTLKKALDEAGFSFAD